MLNVVVRQIKIKDETYEELRDIGKMGESFDAVIRKILDHYKRTTKK
jgi:predicted CopG family antitoxin